MKEYTKYRWFYTSEGTLVVGGKSALQNDELLRDMTKKKTEYYVLHTESPGSPFSVIVKPANKVTKKELEEVAVFTASFSRLWKLGKKKGDVHVFMISQLSKTSSMKVGTWNVKGSVKKMTVPLILGLTIQKKKLRAVPLSAVNEVLLNIKPGPLDKREMLITLGLRLEHQFTSDDILGALPAGGVSIC